jgi:hypothetical protein
MQSASNRTARSRYSSLLYLFASLFFLRVVGQAVQYWFPLDFLPPFGHFQGSSLPYALLLSIQFLMLVFMYCFAWRLDSGKLLPNSRAGRWLMAFGIIYMGGSVTRIAIGVAVVDAGAWFTSWIPAVLHVVLAAFVLTLALFHLRAKGNSA